MGRIIGIDFKRDQKALVVGGLIVVALLVAPGIGDTIGREVILKLKKLITPASVNLIGGK